ncbi:MAG: aryldialkylphosphatase, partial [Chloroflexi bacterium]|nr:aryldialkylphosphatase [Chloroflexota bacterium]
GHIERTIFDYGVLDEVAATGAFMNWDLWGMESTYYPMRADTYMASDQHRIEQIEYMIANGNANQVLLAHDICAKHRLKKWGGHGWDHIIARVVPRIRARGTYQADIDTMLIDNPTRMLTFTEPLG